MDTVKAPRHADHADEATDGSAMRILIVEDEPVIAMLLTDNLKAPGTR